MDQTVTHSGTTRINHGGGSISLSKVDVTLASQAGDVEILKSLTLDIAAGEAVGVVGPSGSGKTTLLMVIAGLEATVAGSVVIAGQDLAELDEDGLAEFRRDQIGIVFQGFHLVPTMTALENVAIPLEFKGDRSAFNKARAQLERVGLGKRLTHYPGQLSGGEQQRVAMARALAAGASIILADEPTGNLDFETGHTIMDLLFDLQKQSGTTLVLVTHDRDLAAACDRVIEIRDGQVV